MEKRPQYVTVKELAGILGRSVSAIRSYLRCGVLIAHDKDPGDNVTDRLIRPHVEVRIALYQWLHRPGLRISKEDAGRLLASICGERDENLQEWFDGRRGVEQVTELLKHQMEIEIRKRVDSR